MACPHSNHCSGWCILSQPFRGTHLSSCAILGYSCPAALGCWTILALGSARRGEPYLSGSGRNKVEYENGFIQQHGAPGWAPIHGGHPLYHRPNAAPAPILDGMGFHGLETWGIATIDSCLRFLNENPFHRLRSASKTCRASCNRASLLIW